MVLPLTSKVINEMKVNSKFEITEGINYSTDKSLSDATPELKRRKCRI